MLIDYCFQRVFLTYGAGVLGAKAVKAMFGFTFLSTLAFNLPTHFLNAGSQGRNRLSDRFKLKSNLPSLAAKAFNIDQGRGDLAVQSLRLAVKRSNMFFRLDNLVACLRSRGHDLQHGSPAGLLLALDIGESGGCRL